MSPNNSTVANVSHWPDVIVAVIPREKKVTCTVERSVRVKFAIKYPVNVDAFPAFNFLSALNEYAFEMGANRRENCWLTVRALVNFPADDVDCSRAFRPGCLLTGRARPLCDYRYTPRDRSFRVERFSFDATRSKKDRPIVSRRGTRPS